MKGYFTTKRISDFTISLVALLLIWPILLIIALLIKSDSKGPVFFKQKRVGKNKKHFYILKFRTMRSEAPKEMPTHMLQNADMFITKIGKFLRKSSLDELPQLINILKGEMSIIGPRPALWNQFDLITERDKYGANAISPGLTGLAQINGRDELPIEIKVRYDGEYVERMSLVFDFKIFIKTVFSVLKHEGIKEGTNS
jgi:O-antigen biosynthesis protein WbqP